MKHLRLFLFSLLGSSYVRLIVGYFRWFYYLKILKRLKTKEISKNIIHNGLSHNLIVFDKSSVASGWKVIISAPASTKSLTKLSTGSIIK